MRSKTLRLITLLTLATPLALSEDRDLASLHQVNILSRTRRNTRLMLHNRFRFYNDLSEFYQFRSGAIVYHDWKPRVQVLAGYYLLQQRADDSSFQTVQRPWAGAQVSVYERGKASLDWRNLVERHIYTGPGDFMRYRSRAMANFQPRGGWQPYAGAEALALKGHVIGRYSVGVNYATERGHLLGFGYEFRQDVGNPGTHFISTMVQFQVSGPRRREKPGEADAPQ